MKNKSIEKLSQILGLVFLLFLTSGSLIAKSKSEKTLTRNHYLWFGANVGLLHIVSETEQEEASKNGYNLGGQAAYSIYGEKRVIDFGLGYRQVRLKRVSEVSDNQKEELEVTTGFGSFDLSYRWRLGVDEFGPKIMATFGGDSSLSKEEEVDKKVNAWLGASWTRTYQNNQDGGTRYGLDFFTDLSIHDRQVYWFNFRYELGLPIIKPDKKVVKVVKVKNKIVEKVVEKVVVKEKVLYRDRIIVDAGFLNFKTARYDLGYKQTQYLQELATYLVQNRDSWEKIILAAHTDSRGSRAYNQKLSQNRAQAVARVLQSRGVPAGMIEINYHGFDKEVTRANDQVSLAKNRRCEITVIGAINAVRLKPALYRILQRHSIPYGVK